MLNKTLCLILMCSILWTLPSYAQSRVKRIFQDNTYNNRTNVIKETGENDYNILDEQFGDAKVGEVVRIAIEKPKEQKPPKPPRPTKPKVVKSKPIKEVEKLPEVKVEREVFTAKGESVVKPPAPPTPRKRSFSASPSEYAPHKTYQAQLPKMKFWKKKKRRKNKSRKSCYHFN